MCVGFFRAYHNTFGYRYSLVNPFMGLIRSFVGVPIALLLSIIGTLRSAEGILWVLEICDVTFCRIPVPGQFYNDPSYPFHAQYVCSGSVLRTKASGTLKQHVL